jgi:hypothetical protein
MINKFKMCIIQIVCEVGKPMAPSWNGTGDGKRNVLTPPTIQAKSMNRAINFMTYH